MDTKLDPKAWIALRAKEPEFVEYMEADTADAAAAAATAKSQDAEGNISTINFSTVKEGYLTFCREKWGLPASAGASL
ncbi:hypothetical protein [Polaromonas sp.]|uniref:hypothetical protein n=1 Tax=Polaromonas sp. TaxID=1869339 RepID=UPI003529F55E